MPKEKPRVNIGEVIKTYRSQRGLSQGDIERRTGLLRQDEIRFLAEIKKYSTTLSEGDKRLVLAMIRKMATLLPPQAVKKLVARRPTA